MAVYERTYRSFRGTLTPERTRFLVLPRYAFESVFSSKLFVALLVFCFVWPLLLAVFLYLPHNLGFLKGFGVDPNAVKEFFRFDANFFHWYFMYPQGGLAFLVAFIVAPALVSADLRNNGLPLYLSRPFTRTEYVLGKMSVLVFLLSAITWIPGLLLWLFQAYLGGAEWIRDNGRSAAGIFFGSWLWILLLSFIGLALSAYVKWKPVARLLMVLVFVVAGFVSGVLNLSLDTHWADVFNVTQMVHVVWAGLFGVESPVATPQWAAWLSLLALCGGCVALLAQKLKAYEVVR